ncbi:uncharacterized protein ACWYII_002053 isoform 4-T4 [Salvelinus alpinus]
MPPRKKRENRDIDDCPRKRRRAQEEGNVVNSDSDEDEDFRPTSSSSRGESKRDKESRTRSNEMTEEEMLDLAMRLSKQEASSAALRQRQEEEAVRKAIAESLSADSPTHPHSESSLGSGSPTQQCQNSPPEGESSIQPPRHKLSYPNHGVADREGARGGGVHVGVAPSDRRGKKEGSPLLDMPDLSQTQKVYSQSSPLSQASISVPLPSSQEEGSSQRNLFGDRSANAIESQDYNNSTKSDSQSQLRIKSPGFPSTTASQANKPVLCLEKLSQDLLVDCQASGFLLKGHPSLTLPTKSQKSQFYQPKSPTFSNTPVFSKTERGVEPGQSSPSFPKRAMFSNSDSGEEEKEASPTVPKSLVFFKTDRGKAEEEGSPTSPKSTMISKSERGLEEKETFSGSPVFSRTDQIRDQGPQSCVERVSTTGDYEGGDRDDAVKSGDASECLPPRPRTTLSLNKRFLPIRKTAGVSDKAVDQEEREGESSQRTVNRISTPVKLATEEDLNSEELTLALETHPMQELTSNMALRWSDDDEEENGPEKSAHSPSPVFPQENDLLQPSNQGLSPNTHDHRSPQHRHSPCLVPKKRTHNFEGAACEEGESQSKCIQKKFTFKGMYGAPSPSLLRQAAGRRSQDEAKAESTSSHQPLASSSPLSPPTDGQGDGGVVCYYWGVPFCPRGQDPDAYTQVILSQLEVYEKSLKEAQRGLLKKAGWGEPVLPGPPEKPFSRRGRLERRRAPKLLEEERGGKRQEELVEVVEDDDDEEEGEKRARQRSRGGVEARGKRGRQEWKDCQDLFVSSPEQEEKSPYPVFHADTSQLILLKRRLGLRREEERLAEKQPPDLLEEREEDEKEEQMDDKEGGEKREEEERMGEEVDVGGLEVPETQLSDDSTRDLMVISPAQPQPESQSLPQIQTFLSSPRPLEQREEGMLVVGEEEGRRSSPVGIPAVGKDVRMEEDIPEPSFPRSPSMDCPMCMRLFPLTEIEMHAAYCDGTTGIMEEEMAEESHSQVKARRKGTRRGEIIGEEQPSSSGSGKVVQGEKCFLCQQLFPLKNHEKHVEDCIKNKEVSKAAPRDGQLFWSSVCGTIFQSGDLLSALDQTEHIYSGTAEAEPCDTTFNNQQSGLIDDLDTAESGGRGDFNAPGFRVSTLPIQSFTPVSEATDCLIDF